jgi:hypothetical protein
MRTGGADIVTSAALFRVTEYEQFGPDDVIFANPEDIRLRLKYQSGALRLRDASRFAAALSYARGAYISVVPADPDEEDYQEWWLAGWLWNSARVPPTLPD